MRLPALALAGVLSLAGCTLAKPDHEANTLRLNLGSEPPSLDWHVSVDSTSFDVVSNLMVGLTQYREDLSCAPSCAHSWDVTDQGRRYVFHLRKDARWTDGKPVIAPDFEYAWKRLLDPKTGGQYAYFLYDIEGAADFNTGKQKDASAVGVKALDDWTLEVRLKKPAAYFLNLTAICPAFPMRKDVVERFGNRWTEAENMVTNGPFKLDSWQHEYKIELAANESYCQGPPRLKKIKMFMIPEQSTAFSLYENNELDVVDNRSISTPDVYRYRNSPEYKHFPLLRNNYIGFNVTKKPFDDVRVRQAFGMAIDRTVFPQILRRGENPSATWIPPGMAGYNKESGLPFDPQKAQALLAQAGYPDGKGFPAVFLLYPTREDTRLVVEAVQDQLKRNLNVHVDLVNQEWKVYLRSLHSDPPPLFRSSWGADYPDPETFMNLFTSYSGNNDTGFKSAVYDRLIEDAEGEQDPGKRAALYERADTMLCREQAALVPSYLSTQNLMVKPWVSGVSMNPLDLQFFKDVVVTGP